METKNTEPTTPAEPPRQMIHWQRALVWHGLGFLTIIVLTLSYDFFDLAHRFFGAEQREVNFTEAIVKMDIILMLWILSGYQLYKIVSRLSYLENFLQICAWCRKIKLDDQWETVEKHFSLQTGKKATHGMCPECARNFQAQATADPAK